MSKLNPKKDESKLYLVTPKEATGLLQKLLIRYYLLMTYHPWRICGPCGHRHLPRRDWEVPSLANRRDIG